MKRNRAKSMENVPEEGPMRPWRNPPPAPKGRRLKECWEVRGVTLSKSSAVAWGGDWNAVHKICDRRYVLPPHRRRKAAKARTVETWGREVEPLGLREIKSEIHAHTFMSKNGLRTPRNTRVYIHGGEVGHLYGALVVEVQYVQHQRNYDHVAVVMKVGRSAEKSEVSSFPRWARYHPRFGPVARGWARRICRERLQLELFNAKALEDLEKVPGGICERAPGKWLRQEESVLNPEVEKQPEQLLYIVREAGRKTAEQLRREPAVRGFDAGCEVPHHGGSDQ